MYIHTISTILLQNLSHLREFIDNEVVSAQFLKKENIT